MIVKTIFVNVQSNYGLNKITLFKLTICTSLFADDRFLPISDVNVAGGAMILAFRPGIFVQI